MTTLVFPSDDNISERKLTDEEIMEIVALCEQNKLQEVLDQYHVRQITIEDDYFCMEIIDNTYRSFVCNAYYSSHFGKGKYYYIVRLFQAAIATVNMDFIKYIYNRFSSYGKSMAIIALVYGGVPETKWPYNDIYVGIANYVNKHIIFHSGTGYAWPGVWKLELEESEDSDRYVQVKNFITREAYNILMVSHSLDELLISNRYVSMLCNVSPDKRKLYLGYLGLKLSDINTYDTQYICRSCDKSGLPYVKDGRTCYQNVGEDGYHIDCHPGQELAPPPYVGKAYPITTYDTKVECQSCGKTGLLYEDKMGNQIYRNVEEDGYHRICHSCQSCGQAQKQYEHNGKMITLNVGKDGYHYNCRS